MTPNTGDIILYDGNRFRVDGWMKNVNTRLGSSKIGFRDMGVKKMFCSKEEAEFVYGSGVCGCIVPVAEAQVVGRVNWSEEQIAELERDHNLLIKEIVW